MTVFVNASFAHYPYELPLQAWEGNKHSDTAKVFALVTCRCCGSVSREGGVPRIYGDQGHPPHILTRSFRGVAKPVDGKTGLQFQHSPSKKKPTNRLLEAIRWIFSCHSR
ncbi:MAG: hypothetical protein CBD74_04035 [Saprospirales bacterium TMED214]|nr:MAG: hypothetical protein CBD74_04035 [Saprospirales bacterium TMED214]